jgi:hypothetical protein
VPLLNQWYQRNNDHDQPRRSADRFGLSLSTLPNVQRLTSTLVMKRVVQDRPLPL